MTLDEANAVLHQAAEARERLIEELKDLKRREGEIKDLLGRKPRTAKAAKKSEQK
jgi:hypothetical protein